MEHPEPTKPMFLAHSGSVRHLAGKSSEPSGRQRSLNYKSELCRNFFRGRCAAGPDCTFAHSEEEREAGAQRLSLSLSLSHYIYIYYFY